MNQRLFLTWIAIASFLIPPVSLVAIPTSDFVLAAPSKARKDPKRTPFYSEAGRFSVDFPGKPTTRSGKNVDGTPLHTFFQIDEPSFYQVAYYDVANLPNLSRKEVQKALIEASTSYVIAFNKKLVGTKNIKVDSNLGLEFSFVGSGLNKSGINGLGRTYFVGKRIYLIIAIEKSGKANVDFLNSFRLR
jgi:hypothetical protein